MKRYVGVAFRRNAPDEPNPFGFPVTVREDSRGGSRLARCLLWDLLGEEPTPSTYQSFKRDVIANFDMHQGWTLTEEDIRKWLEEQLHAS